MINTLINFSLDSATVANPDGTLSNSFTDTTVVSGPGQTPIGDYPKALDFGAVGKAVCDVASLPVNLNRFCIHLVFNATKAVTSRQNLAESTSLPFAVYLLPGNTSAKFNLVTAVRPSQHDWSGPDTLFRKELTLNKWYTASLVYDFDTAALFVDGELVTVHAFPNGGIEKQTGGKLFLGTWADGTRDHFNGRLAAFQWLDGIPEEMEQLVDERRNHAEWFITYKYEDIRKRINTGARTKPLTYLSAAGAHIQHYERCALMYHPSPGIAFEIHGAIYEKYKTLANSESLGYLIGDEFNTTRAGGKKSLFSKGGIYWSGATGAHPVTDKIYAEYESLGESKNWGFPTKAAKSLPNGIEQEFQGARFYCKRNEPKANEVHGAILTRFLATGGVSKWGFPVSNESDIRKGASVIGKFSEFEGCTFYWSASTGACEVHGDIRRKYLEINGPLSDLGFPVSDEINIPNHSGTGKMNTFQKGSILWYGNFSSIKIARPFKIWLGRIDSKESEGLGRGQNDLYIKKIKVTQNSTVLYEGRRPSSGSWGGKNVVDVNFTLPPVITPNNANLKIKLYLDIWEDDSPTNSDDFIGKYEKTLEAANGWGLNENNGIYNVSFGLVRSLTWSVKPQVNMNTLTEVEKWWGTRNRGTYPITYAQYASAYKGVDSDTEWWDVSDWLEKAFYEAAVKGIAEKGNCFGMSLEGIYARKGKSIFAMPLNRFQGNSGWNTIANEINIKHTYQIGANPIWWFLGEFLTGNTHDPVDVFNRTLNEFNRGNHPVICVAQNYDFSGAPHVILPVRWDKSAKPWKITVLDPNDPGNTRELTVNPDNNTFKYVGTSTYSGGAWSGGRFYYMPFCILDERQRVPVWDLLLLLLSGTIIILADDSETVAITDSEGNDLNAFGNRATTLLKNGVQPAEFFVGYNGFESNMKPGQVLVRKEAGALPLVTSDIMALLNLSVSDQRVKSKLLSLTTALEKDKDALRKIKGRSAKHILNDKAVLATLKPELISELEKISAVNSKRNFIHTIKGSKKGKLSYFLKSGLTEIRVESGIALNEVHKLEVNDLATHFCKIKMDSQNTKAVTLDIRNRLGAGGDYCHMTIQNLGVGPDNDLEINVKQGLAGVEILNKGNKTDLQVSITTRINRKDQTRAFVVPVEKGVRLKPVSVITEKELTVSNIERIFGKGRDTYRLK